MNMDDISDEVLAGIESHATSTRHDIFTEQPKHASWLTVDIEMSDGICTDHTAQLEYDNENVMQAELVKAIISIASPKILNQVRNGAIEHLTFRIGPRALSGTNMNEEMGIDELVFSE